MRRAKKILKWVAIAAIVVVAGVQFIGPAKSNPVAAQSQAIEAHLQVPPQVATILDQSCNDCHSNKTRWPWYSNVAPVSWFVIDHVNHGRSHLNFSDWGRFERREAEDMLSSICKEVQSGAMPLSSYTPLHAGSELTSEEIKVLCDWTSSEQARLGIEASPLGARACRPQ
jgi:hypothetical protein